MERWRAAVDIGGTFTDLLLHSPDGRYGVGKVLTDHSSPARPVIAGLQKLLAECGVSAAEVGNLIHATTLATNAIIERRGARTALLVTEGFRDTLTIGREHRYDMYDLLLRKPDPLVPRYLTFGVRERVLADGTVMRPLDEVRVAEVARLLVKRRVEAVAVCLLHSYRYPDHESRVRDIVTREAPGIAVALSHEVVGEQREYERAVTTVANAYVLEAVDRYLGQLERELDQLGHAGRFMVMLSSGAISTPETARRFPVRLVESGPAAGALGAAHASRGLDRPSLLSFDMGGTTAKACIIENSRPTISKELEVARLSRFKSGSGLPLKTSSVELIEIGAGGGSIAWLDRFDLLQVGPDSAGSEPGPACYGLGGTLPTVTDADLVLGYLSPDYFLGGRMRLDREKARDALAMVAAPLGLSIERAAWTIHEVVNENMANAARIHAAERGREVRNFPLFAFGGAGPVHAYRVAMNLGIGEVIAPMAAGVGSTIGLLAAPLAFDFVRTAVAQVRSPDWDLITGLLVEMEAAGKNLLIRAGVNEDAVAVERSADMRLAGQAHEITVALPGDRPGPGDEGQLERLFFDSYHALFDRSPPNVEVEAVNWRVRVSGPEQTMALRSAIGHESARDSQRVRASQRDAYFPETGGFTQTPVYDRYQLGAGAEVAGPAIIEERESTLVIGPGATAILDGLGNLLVGMPA